MDRARSRAYDKENVRGGVFPVNGLLRKIARSLTLWFRWASAVAAGVKTIETRRMGMVLGRVLLLFIVQGNKSSGNILGRVEPFPIVRYVTPGALCAIVWVSKCRPLGSRRISQRLWFIALAFSHGIWSTLPGLHPYPW